MFDPISLGVAGIGFGLDLFGASANNRAQEQEYLNAKAYQDASARFNSWQASFNAKNRDLDNQYAYWQQTVNYNQERAYTAQMRNYDLSQEIDQAENVFETRVGAGLNYMTNSQALSDRYAEEKLPETDALVDLRIEREQYVGRNNPRAKRSLDEVDELIAAEVEALNIKAPERRKKVRDEFQRLSADKELQGLSDEELRAFAIRYGLQMTVDMKQVEGLQWQRLGSMFSGFSVKGDLEAIDYPMQKVNDAVKINMSKS